jgi:valyl-tRNA synthetase
MSDNTEKNEVSENPAIPEVFLKPYDPKETEEALYTLWEESGYFNPDVCIENGVADTEQESFSIVLPPPNVTGTLHIGHAAMLAIEDTLVRYNRMLGKPTLWLPGTDSAAIATQSKVEKIISKEEGKSRHDLGREELLRRVDAFAEESKNTIINQTKRMGSSLDWSRYAFTLDEPRYRAVMTAFKKMYDAGLIYRGSRIVNWDPKGQTTISDDEIVYEERKAKLYTFKYGKDFPISISTTRPETKVGDTAVAVHPDDERYAEFIGKEYDVVFCDVPLHIKIVADESVEKEFGTGALGVTPAHSQTDWEIADRHNLVNRPQVINEYAKMTVDGRLAGMKVGEAREAVVTWLREEGLLTSEEDVDQNVSTAERTGAIIEPLPKLQWWIDVNKEFTMGHSKIPGVAEGDTVTLKTLMHKAVSARGVTIFPDRFVKTYDNWINNLRPWCISRQIWYGHRIPVWYKVNAEGREGTLGHRGDEIYCDITPPEGDGWEQDSDTLDTWFSSGLWTFSTLGWPEETSDMKRYHPTTLLETGYDILFFWVARMILMSTFLTGELPFKHVYLHGLVRDGKGKKMSKSLGNVIDPLDMVEKYGADATRLSLITGAAPGNDVPLSEDKIRGYKHFANKLWNITRFVLTSVGDAPSSKDSLSGADSELIAELDLLTKTVNGHFTTYRIDLACDAIYQYLWKRFADEIIEESKPILSGSDTGAIKSRQYVLLTILTTSLKLLHPFMPFVTEAIWQNMPKESKRGERELLMVTKWPKG